MNPKHELFAQKIAAGMPAGKAYTEVTGKTGPTADVMGCRWLKKVKARVLAIQSAGASKTTLNLSKKLEKLEEIFFAKPNEADGDNPLSEVKMSKVGPFYSFPDKLRALELHAKLSGELREKVEVNASDELAEFLGSLRRGDKGGS